MSTLADKRLAPRLGVIAFCVFYLLCLNTKAEVIELTDESFEKRTQASTGANGNWYVQFYYEGCQACEKIEKDWAKVAKKLVGHAMVARVEAVENPGLRERFDIQDMPVIIMFSEGKMVKYIHPVKSKAIMIAYAKTGFKEMMSNARQCSVEPEFGGAKGDDNCPLILDAVKDVPVPADGQDTEAYSLDIEAKAPKTQGQVFDLTDTSFEEETQATTGTNGNWYVYFYYEGCQACENVDAQWEGVAQELVGHANVARVEAVENPDLRERFDVQDMPVIIMFSEGKMIKYIHPVKSKEIMVAYAKIGFKEMVSNARECAIQPELGGAKGDDNCPLILDAVRDVPKLQSNKDEL